MIGNNDWNFTGEDIHVYKEDVGSVAKYPVIIIFCLLLCFGLPACYSACADIVKGTIFRYLLFFSAGSVVGLLLYFSGKNKLSVLIPVLLIASFICFILFENASYFSFVMLLLYIAFFMSNRENSINSVHEFLYPMILSVFFLVVSFFKLDITVVILYALEFVFVFAVCSAGLKNILIFSGFVSVPLLVLFMTDYQSLSSFMDFIRFPDNAEIRNILVSSSVTGQGIGAGRLKSYSVFLNFIDETGLVGICVYVFFLFVILFIGIRFLSKFKYNNTLKSNICYISSLFIVLNSAVPALNELYVLPVFGLSVPFFSADLSLTAVTICFFLLLKCFSKVENTDTALTVAGGYNVKV